MTSLEVRPVLCRSFTETPPLLQLVAAQVSESRHIGATLKEVQRVFPLPTQLYHLKRVKVDKTGIWLLVSTVAEISELTEGCETKCDDDGAQILTTAHNGAETPQHDGENATNNPTNVVCMTGRLPGNDDENLFKKTRDLLQRRDVDTSQLISFSVVSVSSAPPLTRAQFDALKGYWPTTFHPNNKLEASISGTHWTEAELTAANTAFSRLVGGVSAIGPRGTVSVNEGRHPAMKIVAQVAGKRTAHEYLLTGHSVYLAKEPCLRCAMALVHGRVARVFFIETSPQGALLTNVGLHTLPALNHHFEVYQMVRETS